MHARCITVYCTFHISKLISKGVCIFTGFNNFCFTCFCIGKLLPGMNVDGVITLAQADDVLTIPVDARDERQPGLCPGQLRNRGSVPGPAGFKAVQVETGLMNDSYVEITSGLNEGDVVYVAESTQTSSFMMMPGGGMGGGGMGGGPGGGMGGGPGGGGGGPR